MSIQRSLGGKPDRQPAFHAIAVVLGSVVIWLFVFGIVGLFVRYFDRPNERMRYLADASYWIYLVHLPLMVWIPLAIRALPFPAIAKFTMVLAISIPLLLASYEWFVRYTAIGRMLNGAREREPADDVSFGVKYQTAGS